MTIKIHAPFYIKGWQWHTFTATTLNTYAACARKAAELGASSWDTSQASVMINGTVTQGHPTVFA